MPGPDIRSPDERSADEIRGKQHAELARQLLLWLQDHDLPNVPGTKGTKFEDYVFVAGTYRKLELSPSEFQKFNVQQLSDHELEEQKRIIDLGLLMKYVLMIYNPPNWIELPS